MDNKRIRAFERLYDGAWEQWEAEAYRQREEFVQRYPSTRLPSIKMDDYVIGLVPHRGYCYWAESKTKKWASIQGGTAQKFGIYFGKWGDGSRRKYRFKSWYGNERTPAGQVFREVKKHLLDLIAQGRQTDFDAIDENPLPQVFKAKLLSLYFPKQYINICSERALKHYAKVFSLESESCAAIQHQLLLQRKAVPSDWSTWKFTRFLFHSFPFRGVTETVEPKRRVKRGKPSTREPDFDAIQRELRKIGRKSEKFALAFEKDRLRGIEPPWQVKNVSRMPAYGYDLESNVNGRLERRIEVKTARSKAAEGFRFFVTAHELNTSRRGSTNYWFYFVEWQDTKPAKVHPVSATEFHKLRCLAPASFVGYIELASDE
jgi:hypothetical protein